MKEWRKIFISVVCWCENDETAVTAEKVREERKFMKN